MGKLELYKKEPNHQLKKYISSEVGNIECHLHLNMNNTLKFFKIKYFAKYFVFKDRWASERIDKFKIKFTTNINFKIWF